MVKSKPLEMEMSCNSGIGIERREKRNPAYRPSPKLIKNKPAVKTFLRSGGKKIPAFHPHKKPEPRRRENPRESGLSEFGNPAIPGFSFRPSTSLEGLVIPQTGKVKNHLRGFSGDPRIFAP